MSTVGIAGAAFRLPAHYISIEEMRAEARPQRTAGLQIPKLRDLTFEEVHGVHAFREEDEGALAVAAIRELLDARGIAPQDIDMLVDYSTVSRASNGLSLCYKVQHQVGAARALPIAVGNGSCIALQLALRLGGAMLATQPGARFAVLFAEDRVRGERLNPPANVLGDGSSALLLENDARGSIVSETAIVSIGAFSDILGIHHWDDNNFDVAEFENRIVPLHHRIIRDLVMGLLGRHGLDMEQIDLILYQNMSVNDCRGLAFALDVPLGKVQTCGLRGRGHIFGSDLVINFRDATDAGKLPPGSRALMISSGAGFSWGATLVTT